jgi:hypothetical protein
MWTLALAWLLAPDPYRQYIFLPTWLVSLTLTNFILNLLTQWYMALHTAQLYRKYRASIFLAAVLYPLYLQLHSVASYKALWQLIVKPHFWEKTPHGLAKEEDAGREDELLQNQEISVDSAAVYKLKGRLSALTAPIEGLVYESSKFSEVRQEA